MELIINRFVFSLDVYCLIFNGNYAIPVNFKEKE